MVNLKSETTFERLIEYSKYCLKGGLKVNDLNEKNIVKFIDLFENSDRGIALIGRYGSGKSLLFAMMHKITNPKSKNIFTTLNSIDTVLKFNSVGHEVFSEWERKNIMINDLGSEDVGSFFGKTEVFEKYILFRYELFLKSKVKMHFTSNFNNEMILKRYGGACYSRITEMTDVIVLDGSYDYRNLRNFIGFPQVYHPVLKTKEELEWDKMYHEKMMRDQQRVLEDHKEGIGEKLKKQFEEMTKRTVF